MNASAAYQGMGLEEVGCDLCGADDKQRYECIAPHADHIVQCKQCGLVYTSPRPVLGRFSEASAADPSVWRPPEVLQARQVAYFKNLLTELSHWRQGGSLLDIGCGHGFFLDLARQMGFNVSGVELQDSIARYARETLRLDVTAGDLFDANYPGGSFEVVTAIALLEHVPSPRKLLLETHRILKRGGMLLLVVPNIESWKAKHWASWWQPWHFFHFSPESIRSLLTVCGFTIERLTVDLEAHLGRKRFEKRRIFLYTYLGWAIRALRRCTSVVAVQRLVGKLVGAAGITVYARKHTSRPGTENKKQAQRADPTGE